MSVQNADVIDGIGVDDSTNTLVLLIIDPFTWEVQELEHLRAIQAKINNYVAYIESKGYASRYKNRSFDGFRIEFAFKYHWSANAETVLSAGKYQLKKRGIAFVYSVAETDE